jgi:nitrite reductase (NADH) small subunit
MGEFIKAIAASEIAPGQAKEVSVAGHPVAIVNVAGTFYALSNTCIHRGGPLGQGFVEGQNVTCPWHAWTFDVTTGANVMNPELKVPCYLTKVEEGMVLVKVE